MNYFELFELPVAIKVDVSKLAKKYFELQKKYHPDFFVQGTEYEQAEALDLSSQLNKALKVLKDEDQVIKYVLQLKGLLEEEEKYQLPPAFLMEMMDLNEELGDDSANEVNNMQAGLRSQVSSIIEEFDDIATPESDLIKLKEYYYKKKYLQRILDRLDG